MNNNFFDLFLKYDETTNTYDFVFEKGGFKLDYSLESSIIVDFTTDIDVPEISQYNPQKKKGNLFYKYGNKLWSLVKHTTLDEETILLIQKECIEIFDKYVENEVWYKYDLDIIKINNNLLNIILTIYSKLDNKLSKYTIPYKLTGKNYSTIDKLFYEEIKEDQEEEIEKTYYEYVYKGWSGNHYTKGKNIEINDIVYLRDTNKVMRPDGRVLSGDENNLIFITNTETEITLTRNKKNDIIRLITIKEGVKENE